MKQCFQRTYLDNRRDAIAELWPPHLQLEALTENMMGRPEKLAALLASLESIKVANPK